MSNIGLLGGQKNRHDPGGKVRLRLPDGVRGRAEFSPCGRYRYWLSREWGEEFSPYVLWIGMNPSTAEADVDDPTIRREINFSRAWGFTSFVKVNVLDYRATDPKALLTVQPRSDVNLPCITTFAARAGRIVLAWGALPKPLRRYADDVIAVLRGYPLYCMKKTKSGAPHHSLYLPYTSVCSPWP